MDYKNGYVYELMDQGGPTNVMEPYFMEAVDEMMRARTLCAKANAGIKNIEIQKYYSINRNNLKEIERFLRLQAVRIKQSQIDYAINCIESTQKAKNAKELKSAKKNLKKIGNWNGNVDRGMSIRIVENVSGLGKNKSVELLM